jgi:hypothetical protein
MTRVAVIHPIVGDEIAARHAARLEAAGAEVLPSGYMDPLPQPLDAVFVYGPFGSLAPLIRQLDEIGPAERPAFVLIQGEQLPNPDIPDFLLNILGDLRSALELRAYIRNSDGSWQPRPGWGRLTPRALRLRYFGDLRRLQRAGRLDGLMTWSRWTAGYLKDRGYSCSPLPPLYNPAWGADLGLERDIPVLWLGKIGTRRRARLLKQVRAGLQARGIEMMVIDGVENPYIFGVARTRLLNRTRIMLNLLREKWDNNSLRFILAAHNGALVVGEPVLPHTAFEPDEHMVVAPVAELAERIAYYLEHEAERARIAGQALDMLKSTSGPGDLIVDIIMRAASMRAAYRGGEKPG